MEIDYYYQNIAFCSAIGTTTKYVSYDDSNFMLDYLQAYLNYYYEATGIDITLSEVEEFLKDKYNEDGTPKTYKDAEELICDYVNYYKEHYTSFDWYLGELSTILL